MAGFFIVFCRQSLRFYTPLLYFCPLAWPTNYSEIYPPIPFRPVLRSYQAGGIFYLLSRFIPKDQFGDFQWTTAVGSTLITIGSLGLDMVLVKRIAAGNKPVRIAGIHFFHTLIVSIAVLAGLLLTLFLFPHLQLLHPLFLLIILQQALGNIANSFKFSLTGFQSFRQSGNYFHPV
ncbi:MAG: hypothetical protein QM743_13090 [Chitinophagaceae bacterium]